MSRYTAFDDDDNEKICRICFDTSDTSKKLLHPCRCSGTQKYVHEECLTKWRETQFSDSNTNRCGVCRYDYKFTEIKPYWFFRLGYNKNKLPSSVTFRVAFTSLLFVLLLDMIFSHMYNDSMIKPFIPSNTTLTREQSSNIHMFIYDYIIFLLSSIYILVGIICGKCRKSPGINVYLKTFNMNSFIIIGLLTTLIMCGLFVKWYIVSLILSHLLNYVTYAVHFNNIYMINTRYMYSICDYNLKDDKERQKSIDDLDI